ncbi:vWA domain-containing protein [Fontivita pretiosa]|uniref:vWA domain-containing protein n=1 Tax=Fontivita pretiosa TaxID=2989684 RepID=UPI003D17E7E8
MSVTTPIPMLIATTLLAGIAAVVLWRRPAGSWLVHALLLTGTALLAAAAGNPSIQIPQRGQVVVMVDCSASTRTARFRDERFLHRRIDELVDGSGYRVVRFSDDSAPATQYEPSPDAAAIVLFSDGRFALPADPGPPTYPVVDPNLESPSDAAVVRLEPRDGSDHPIAVTIRNTGPPRRLLSPGPTTASTGTTIVSGQAFARGRVAAQLAPGDAWPENDRLSLYWPPPQRALRWWIGDSPPPAADEWQAMLPAQLPVDAAEYLSAAAIVLANVPADALSDIQQQRLVQYVRDLGGGLVIVGGQHAFAAGSYPGSQIESISPLASTPPEPARQWILLADASGSMAAPIAADSPHITRWQRAAEALMAILRHLPADEPVSVGCFARDLQFWSQARSAAQTASLQLPTGQIAPHGPTNLQLALESIASQLDGSLATELLLITDADATIDNPDALAATLAQKRLRLHLLATSDPSRSAVSRLVAATGGTILNQTNPHRWIEAATHLARQAMPDLLVRSPLSVQFTGELASLPTRTLTLSNRTWLRRDAIEVARASFDGQHIPLGAHWQFGAGRVAALAFEAMPDELFAITVLVEHPPRDPRFTVTWQTDSSLSVCVDAIDNGTFLNRLDLKLDLLDPARPDLSVTTLTLNQVAPGRYSIDVPSPRSTLLARLRLDGQTLDRRAIAERYPPEFDALGNDHQAMKRLAESTGGQVIFPNQTGPIDFRWPLRKLPLLPILCIASGAMIALALIVWKLT